MWLPHPVISALGKRVPHSTTNSLKMIISQPLENPSGKPESSQQFIEGVDYSLAMLDGLW